MVRHLRIRDFVPPGQHFHLAAPVIISNSTPDNEHDHDFYEVFYVNAGLGWHWINGARRTLAPGTLVLVRDSDTHALTAEGQNLQIVNIAFARRYWSQLLKRYFSTDLDPMRLHVDERSRAMPADDQQLLRQLCARMSPADRTCAHLDHFLMEVLWMRRRPRSTPVTDAPMPEWLTTALRHMTDPGQLQGGTRALADLAGRSPDHVSRAAKRWLGKSPTELLTEVRMEYAARQMAGTNRSILDIAADCGLPNLAHFYKLFAARYGCTPRRYRLQQSRIIGAAS